MKTYLDLTTWPRREHFDFFRRFSEPFFGITTPMDVTKAYQRAKQSQFSFFTHYLHCSLKAANETTEMRYRIEEDQIVIYDQIHASATLSREDGSFDFSLISYNESLNTFATHLASEVERAQNSSGLSAGIAGADVIHYSAIPWLKFTALSHARNFAFADSCPKISFSKIEHQQNRILMNVSIHAHHGLMDGRHLGAYIDRFQHYLDEEVG